MGSEYSSRNRFPGLERRFCSDGIVVAGRGKTATQFVTSRVYGTLRLPYNVRQACSGALCDSQDPAFGKRVRVFRRIILWLAPITRIFFNLLYNTSGVLPILGGVLVYSRSPFGKNHVINKCYA